jgi:methylmalonyl-CoA/ethylmalonyl-CoA epimerase
VNSDSAGPAAVDHVGVAVADLEAAVRLYRDVLGMPLVGREVVESEGCEVAFLGAGSARVELLRPLSPDGPVGRHLERRGPGIHHLAVRVADLEGALAAARAAGIEVLGGGARPGAGGARVAFLHPRGAGGVLLELTTGRTGEEG